jgi:uncharacterized protein YggE
MDLLKNKKVVWTAAVVVLIIAGYFVYNSGPVVSAQGSASLKVVPDEVSVNINVETKNESAQGAQSLNKEISEKLFAGLVGAGFNKDELKFVNYYINPDYDWKTGKQKGYVVSQQLVVKTANVEKVPSVVDTAVSAGALVSYINFELSEKKQNENKIKALEEASKDAKDKAKAIAEGQGRRLGRLVGLNNQEFNYPGPIYAYQKGVVEDVVSANAEARKAASNLAPNEMEISASVSASYRVSLF